jgi:hypothetical protein
LGERINFRGYYESHFAIGFQNKSHFPKKLHANSEFQAAGNIVSHSAFVNAIIHLAVEEKRGEAVGAKSGLGALKIVSAFPQRVRRDRPNP